MRYHCTISGCTEVVRHLKAHLRNKHKISIPTDDQLEPIVLQPIRSINTLSPSDLEETIPDNLADIIPREDDEVEADDNLRFTNRKLSNRTSKLMDEFVTFLESPDGGRLRGAKAYANDLVKIINGVGGDIKQLNAESCYAEYVRSQLQIQKTTANGDSSKTIRNRLRSVILLCEFIAMNKPDLMRDETFKSNVEEMRKRLPRWILSLRKECAEQTVKQHIQDRSSALTLDDVRKFKTSGHARRCLSILSKPADEILHRDFTSARNYLITLICLGNANRSGVLSELSLDDYGRALSTREPNSKTPFVVEVASHKTAVSYGPATISISESEALLMDQYLRMRRSVARESDRLFINSTGKRMSTSNISNAINTSFTSAGMRKIVSCTSIRKFAVTVTHAKAPHMKSKLSTQMLHSSRTAEKHYLNVEKGKNAQEVGAFLRRLTAPLPSVAETATASVTTSNAVQHDEATEAQEDHRPAAATMEDDQQAQAPEHDPYDFTAYSNSEHAPETAPETAEKKTRMRVFSAEDDKLLEKIFFDLIIRKVLSMKDVKERLSKFPDLHQHFIDTLNDEGPSLYKRVYDKIRNLIKNRESLKRKN